MPGPDTGVVHEADAGVSVDTRGSALCVANLLMSVLMAPPFNAGAMRCNDAG